MQSKEISSNTEKGVPKHDCATVALYGCKCVRKI